MKTNQEIIEEFHRLEKSLPTDGLTCPVCSNVYPVDIYGINLNCKKDNCDGIVMSALGFAKHQFKIFLNKALEAKDKACKEAMIEFVESAPDQEAISPREWGENLEEEPYFTYGFNQSRREFKIWKQEKLTQLKS